MDAYTISAISALITGLVMAFGQLTNSLLTVYQARQKQKQDEVTLLREEVARLHASNDELRGESDRFRVQAQRAGSETLWLRTYLREQKLTAPPLPAELTPEENATPATPTGPSIPPGSIHPLRPVLPPGADSAEPPRGANPTERR